MRHKLRLSLDFRKFFVTSDNHFGHRMMAEKIRHYSSVDEHDRQLVWNWNKQVPEDGTVLLFGDFSFLNVEKTRNIVDRLNGTKYIIPGNHDDSKRLVKWFGEDFVLPEITNVRVHNPETDERAAFVASHYPLASWDGSDKGSLMLHGHLHSKNNEVSHHFCAPFQGAGTRFDIGIDNAGWFGYHRSPIPFTTVWNEHLLRKDRWAKMIAGQYDEA